MQSLKEIHAWAQMKVPLYKYYMLIKNYIKKTENQSAN